MNLDLGTLCLLGIIIVAGILLLPRLLAMFGGGSPGLGGSQGGTGGGFSGRSGGGYYDQPGSESPSHDDPDIQSRGGFGGSQGSGSGGSTSGGGKRSFFGGGRSGGTKGSSSSGGSSGGTKSSGGARRNDSPDVKSRGGFGGSKDN